MPKATDATFVNKARTSVFPKQIGFRRANKKFSVLHENFRRKPEEIPWK